MITRVKSQVRLGRGLAVFAAAIVFVGCGSEINTPVANADLQSLTTRVLHGFGSTGMENEAGRLFESLADDEKDITILFLGDHDPSGRVIEQDIHRRVEAASGARFDLTRLAIHEGDIRRFNLPPQRIKSTDSRAAGFRRSYGDNAPTVELDALPADELRRRIDSAVSGLVDHDQWNRDVRVQEVEYSTIADIVGQVNAALNRSEGC